MEPKDFQSVQTVPTIDLNNPDTFRRQKLTPEQGKQRLSILQIQQETLQKTSENLSPRSSTELAQLTKVFSGDAKPSTVKIIRKTPIQFYQIEFNTDPVKPLIEKFNQLSGKINALKTQIANKTQVGILEALIKPKKSMEWYQTVIVPQLRTDFLDALKCEHMMNLRLLVATKSLSNQTISKTISNLHKTCFDLYQDQIDCNRQCEKSILEHSNKTLQCLLEMRDSILTCGPRFEIMPEDFLKKNNQLVEFQERNDADLFKQIQGHSEKFLKKLILSKETMDTCVKAIAEAIGHATGTILPKNWEIELQMTIKVKQAEVQDMNRLFKENMGVQISGTQPIQSIAVAIHFIEGTLGKLLNNHAIWIQSNKKSFMIQTIRNNENTLKNAMTEDTLNRGSESLDTGKMAIDLLCLGSGQDSLSLKLVSNEQLLEIVKGDSGDVGFSSFDQIQDPQVYSHSRSLVERR